MASWRILGLKRRHYIKNYSHSYSGGDKVLESGWLPLLFFIAIASLLATFFYLNPESREGTRRYTLGLLRAMATVVGYLFVLVVAIPLFVFVEVPKTIGVAMQLVKHRLGLGDQTTDRSDGDVSDLDLDDKIQVGPNMGRDEHRG